jgi:Uncharacterized conserved protein
MDNTFHGFKIWNSEKWLINFVAEISSYPYLMVTHWDAFGGGQRVAIFLGVAMEDRAIFLVDGPNFYRNLRSCGLERGHLDFMKLADILSGPRKVTGVVFFTSPTDQAADASNYANQQRFFAALQNSGVDLRLGKIVMRNKVCPLCNQSFEFKTEKSVDVQLALEVALGAAKDSWDTAYVATCDSDIIPAIDFARSQGKKIFLLLPDGANCYSVGRACDASITITQKTLNDSQAFE